MSQQIEADEGAADRLLAHARLAAIVDSSFDAIISKDLNSVVTSWNRAAEEIFGYRAEEAIGKSILFIVPEDRLAEEDDIIGRIRRGERIATFETIRRHKDGRLLPVSVTISPIRDCKGAIIGASKIARDISLSKEKERHIALLLHEVHHRVKNNLQTVSSLIQLQPMPEDVKQELQGRVLTIAAVHEHLHRPASRGHVNLGIYLSDLIVGVNATFGSGLSLKLDMEAVQVTSETATTLGLVTNELITNANKYAFPKGQPGTFNCRLERGNGQIASMHLRNNGVPFSTDVKANGIGIRLIRGLASSLDPDYRFDGEYGLDFRISFPVAEEDRSGGTGNQFSR